MTNCRAFTLIENRLLEDRGITAKIYRHPCGLEITSLETQDVENFFCFCFGTEPTDSTGVPHIIEHSVLGGSEKYPVKDPFIELIKSSAAEFINALTFNDYTLYPCVTANHRDYFNLFEVYWDAVFHPRISRETFMQEGWHYELHNGKLSRNGIVLNEMTGYYGEVGTISELYTRQNLLPQTPLAHDSGGNPEDIGTLSYEEFLKYYRLHYTPASTKILLYGNISTEEKLKFIARHLKDDHANTRPAYAPQPPSPVPPRQPRWTAPRHVVKEFSPETPKDSTGIAICSWFIDDTRDIFLDLTMQLLDAVLTGNSGSPMTKALMSSELGTSTFGMGYDADGLETTFGFGLRGIKTAEDRNRFFELVDATLRTIVADGLPFELKLAALRQLQLDNRHQDSGNYLDIIGDVFSVWRYNRNPLLFLDNKAAFASLEKQLESNPRFVEEAIQKHLIDNPHCLRLELIPDKKLKARKHLEQRQKLDEIKNRMTASQLKDVQAEAKRLHALQQMPNPPEALATLPRLRKKDISPEDFHLPISESILSNGLRVARGDISGNGLAYMQFVIDMSGLPPHLLPSIPLFSQLFKRVGIEGMAYDELARQMDFCGMRLATGVGFKSHATLPMENRNYMFFSMMSLENCLEMATSLLEKILTSKIFTETKRIRESLRQLFTLNKSALLSPSAYTHCLSRATAGLSGNPLYTFMDEIDGFNQFFMLENLVAHLTERNLERILAPMREIAQWLRSQPIAMASFVGSDNACSQAMTWLEGHAAAPRMGNFMPKLSHTLSQPTMRRECFKFGSIASCVRVFSAPAFTDPRSPSISLLGKMLGEGYLWNEVRMQNGAYGAFASYEPFSCHFALISSEDPSPVLTYGIFDDIRSAAAQLKACPDELNSALVSIAGKSAAVNFKPGGLCSAAMKTMLFGLTESVRKQSLANLLATTPSKFADDIDSFIHDFGDVHNDCMIGPSPAKEFSLIQP